jgi:copper transport protein
MGRRLAAIVAAWGLLLAGPAFAGPAGWVALGHAQLVASNPGSGEVVASPPTRLTLTFSESFEAAYSNVDLLDPNGATVLTHAGRPDPADAHVLVVDLPSLGTGIYTVDWRTVSAADGHDASGFFTFGVGNVSAPPVSGGSSAGGDLHAGHGAGLILLDTESRALADLGFLLALGFAIAAALVLRSTTMGPAIGYALGIGAFGSLALGVVAAASAGAPSLAELIGTRTGRLILARLAVAVVGIGLILIALRARRPGLAVAAGGVAGLLGLGLIVASGHAAGFASPAPAVAALVHVTAAAAWIGGLATVAWVAIAPDPERPLPVIVPRFSAVALVAIGLVAATGLYADWLLTGAPLRFDTPYAVALLVKVAIVVAALTFGALNYLDGGRGRPIAGDFRRRVVLEAGLALAVVVATGNLASGSPPALSAPVAIEPAFSSAAAADATLALAPGRPGPTRFVVTTPGMPAAVELVLSRIDSGSGLSHLPLRHASMADDLHATFVGDGTLPVGSSWDATVVVRDAAGTETGRTRFQFALDASGIVAGRAAPPIDLGLLIAVGLTAIAVLLGVFTLAGGTLPRVDRRAGRIAVTVGVAIAGVLAVILLLAGGG